MPQSSAIKPTHKAIKQYYQSLREYQAYDVKNEGAVETAFSHLLAATSRTIRWQLLPKQPLQLKDKKSVIPDATLRDIFNPRCGFWEAKDSQDDLDQEISKKLAKGYSTNNTIVEDTRQAVLFQGGQERGRFDLTDAR